MGSAETFSGIHLLLKVFRFEAFVNRSAGNSFINKITSRCDFQQDNYFIGAYWKLTAILIKFLLSVLSICIWTIKQLHTEFIDKYRHLIVTCIYF